MPGGFPRRQPAPVSGPAGRAGPGLIRGAAYVPFSASYFAMMPAGMRPRELTYRPWSLAQSRISLFLGSAGGVLRAWAARLADPVTLRAALT